MTAIATSLPRFRCGAGGLALVVLLLGVLGGAPRSATAAPAGSILVLPASGRNVSEAIIVRARSALVQELADRLSRTVVDMDRPPTADAPPPPMAAHLAFLHNAQVAVSLDLSHEAGQTTITVTCIEAATWRSVCALGKTTAAGPDVAPGVAANLSAGILAALGVAPVEQSVAAAPSSPGPARSARWLFVGAHATLVAPLTSPGGGSGVMSGWGLSLRLDGDGLLVDLFAEYTSAADRSLAGVGVGLLVPLARGDWQPYGGVRGLWVTQHLGRGEQGAQLRPTLGVMWGRPSSPRLSAEVGYFVDLFQEQEADRLFSGSDRFHRAHGLLFSAGAAL